MTTTDTAADAARIAALNDALRRTAQGGMTLISQGLAAKGAPFVVAAREAVRGFHRFTEANDPYGDPPRPYHRARRRVLE